MITTIETQTSEMSTVDALWVLIQSQSKRVRQALAKRILAEVSEQREQCELTQTLPSRERSRRSQHEQTKKQAQQKMVEDSLTRAFDELHAGKAHRDARKLFKW